MEYITYMIEMEHIQGDKAVEALGFTEERREELLVRKEEQRLAGTASSVRKVQGPKLVRGVQAEEQKMLDAVTKMVVLLKLIAVLLSVLCVLIAVKK